VQDLLEKMTGAFGEHEATTREHERRLRARLRTLGAGPSKPREVGLKTVALLRAHLARIGGQNHGAGARDAFVFEHLEIASWELLEHLADRAGDPETAELARECRADDDEMAALIRRNFPNVVSLMLASEGLPTLREPEESDEGEREESEASSEEGEAEDHAAGLPQERPGVGVQEAARLQNEGEVRATGAKQMILFPNTRSSDTSHWSKYSPQGGPLDRDAAVNVTDSVFDMHSYSSIDNWIDDIKNVTDWARRNNKRLFLSELGTEDGPALVSKLLSYIRCNGDVWVGWTMWNLAPYQITTTDKLSGAVSPTPKMAWYERHFLAYLNIGD
jgi:ferritin-like metal-binding protein YciE